jgi:hypothetical protein
LILTTTLIFTLSVTNAIVLKCDFKVKTIDDEPLYTCDSDNFRTLAKDRNVSRVTGVHTLGRSDESVKRLMIEKEFCRQLPLGIGEFFKKLEFLYVRDSNVQYLQKGDLDGLKTLKTLDLSHNPIDYLTADVFEGQESIRRIVFWGCHLRYIDPNVLEPLINLREALFDDNICIDSRCESKNCMEGLKKRLEPRCRDTENLSCYKKSKNQEKPKEEANFAERHAYLIVSFFSLFLLVQGVILFKVLRGKTFRQVNNLEFENLRTEE